MLKQKKKLNFTKNKLTKNLIRLRKLYSKSTKSFNIYFKKILQFFRIRNKSKKIYIRLTQNNMFCTLVNSNSMSLLTSSGGKYKIKTSKRKIKFSSSIILKSFLKEIKQKIINNKLLITVIAPKSLKKKIVGQLSKTLPDNNIFIEVSEKKTFNGCRPKKQKRKKRKGLRIYKK